MTNLDIALTVFTIGLAWRFAMGVADALEQLLHDILDNRARAQKEG